MTSEIRSITATSPAGQPRLVLVAIYEALRSAGVEPHLAARAAGAPGHVASAERDRAFVAALVERGCPSDMAIAAAQELTKSLASADRNARA